ncbi:MAG: hypothetical protein ABJ059_00310, partial [Hyphomicrobiales bacterium]
CSHLRFPYLHVRSNAMDVLLYRISQPEYLSMQITRRQQYDDHILSKTCREIEDADIPQTYEVIYLPHTSQRGFNT